MQILQVLEKKNKPTLECSINEHKGVVAIVSTLGIAKYLVR